MRTLNSPAVALAAAMVAHALLSAVPGHAQPGLDLSWSQCAGDGPLVTDMAFACNTNAGAHTLVCSMVAPAGVTQFGGVEFLISLISKSSPLSPWWGFYNTGACRQSSLGVNTSYAGSGAGCTDLWALAPGAGGVASYGNTVYGLPGINPGNVSQFATMDLALAVAEGSEFPLVAGRQYFVANVVINHALTTGVGSCAGCADPVCLSFSRLNLFQPGQTDILIGQPDVNTLVTWQGTGADCAAVPVRQTTWGAIKSLYR